VRLARRAALQGVVELAPLAPLLDVEAALAADAHVLPPVHLARGDPRAALARAPRRLSGTARSGGQDHFYLEGQVSLAVPGEDGGMHVYVSTQHPGEVQHMVARALAVPDHAVVVECRRMGGGFGGKETQMCQFACIAAVLARRTGHAVKLRLDRDTDMVVTGKRHAFRHDYEVGFDAAGRILALELTLASRCGFSADLSGPVNDRAVFHADNANWLPDVAIHSYRLRTNTVSDTAFRGFGGPQGMFAIELVLDDIARTLGLDPLDVRKVNLYGIAQRNVTPYGMTVEDNIARELIDTLELRARYRERRRAIAQWNAAAPVIRRGIALTPVKFGISFTATHYNQAGALLHAYADGSALLNHGGTEMGQGLFVKVQQVVAHELGLPLERVRVSASDTSKVPNASPTAASSGSDLNGMAAQRAAQTLRARLAAFAAARYGCEARGVTFGEGRVHAGGQSVAFAELVRLAYLARVPLSATGFYATPKVHYDPQTLTGRPFFYFAYGAAVSEVAVDTLTGEHRLLAVDILHDAGRSLNPAIDRGQVEGGFLQGYGWLTMEELWWDADGRLGTHAPSTYKIPTAHDCPASFRIDFHDAPNRENTIHRSKAVGEPPLMLALSAFHALRDAIAGIGGPRAVPCLDAPATPERVLAAVEALRAMHPARGFEHHPAPVRAPAVLPSS
jgi:xanthine dehydrogenase large subunit